MSIRRLNDDLSVISSLSDEPNDVEGLSAHQLKSKFDQAGNSIKAYINDSLIPDVETEIVGKVNETAVAGGGMPAFGLAGQSLIKRSDASFDWDFKHILPPGGKTGYVLVKSSDSDYDTHFAALPIFEWKLIASYSAGIAFTWLAPNPFGNGAPYEIGVFIIGGGGSGGIACGNDPCIMAASGGASGYTKAVRMTVTPGTSYSGVTGVGGSAVQMSYTAAPNYRLGEPGSTSSFAEYSAKGGGFGFSYCASGNDSVAVPGACGAQGSDAATACVTTISTNTNYKFNLTAPAMGSPGQPIVYATTNNFREIISYPGGSAIPGMCRNPFTEELMLAAGGGAGAAQTGWAQSGYVFETGYYGGSGAVEVSTGLGYSRNVTGKTATSIGSGGGAAVSRDNPGTTVKSGAGANGAVLIYTRKALA